ncbi:MAG: peptidoglycan DD-metalloendopeptidase family protein [Tannerella sp.]|jgi:septal ring factor EnvC (AmiA/AmiB activator)|nr:peptidoglycan DD-metalloendopeptidase family protein [Tannerella sp.]
MKRLYIVIVLACCCTASTPSFAQANKKNGDRSMTGNGKTPKKTTASGTTTNRKTPGIQIPAAGLYSVQELESQRKKTLDDIELTSRLLNETSANAKNSLNRLNLLSQQLLSRKRILTLLEQEIAAIEAKIQSMNDNIDILNKDLAGTKENYAKSMLNRQQEQRTAQYKMLLILSAKDIAQSFRRMRYLREYSDWQKKEAERIINKQNEIADRKAELEKTRNDKQILLTQREEENKKLELEEQLQQEEVRELNKKRKELQTQLQQKKKEADNLNKEIEALIAEDILNSGKNSSAATSGTVPESAAPETAKPAASTGGKSAAHGTVSESAAHAHGKTAPAANYRMTETELHLAKDFAGNKGKLPYPLNGNFTVISIFGEHQHQELSHVRTNNNGIDLQTTSGAEACAIFKGVVTRVFVMPGYNNNVIVRHGNYLSVYSNLSQVYVRAGDVVETLQPLGKIFTDTEKGNETILHFQIWKERAKLNPSAWIKR